MKMFQMIGVKCDCLYVFDDLVLVGFIDFGVMNKDFVMIWLNV